MPTIKQLEQAYSKANKERLKLYEELEDAKEKKQLPALKKKFEGKYFKFDNGYNHEDRWFIYTYCHEIKSRHLAIVDTFQFIPAEGWRFSVAASEGLFLLQTEITPKEYDKEAIQVAAAARSFIAFKD